MNRPPITHVAIRFRDKVWSLPAPKRHADIIQMIRVELETDYGVSCQDLIDEDYGFLDADGLFLNRRQALYNAQKNNQIKSGTKIKLGLLLSENIW